LKCGIVYLISNEAFPGYLKIGMTQNLDKRLSQYQTYDPFRRFKVEDYAFVIDRALEEKRFISKWSIDLGNGEWVPELGVREAFKNLKNILPS
jgi:hypothetical protein